MVTGENVPPLSFQQGEFGSTSHHRKKSYSSFIYNCSVQLRSVQLGKNAECVNQSHRDPSSKIVQNTHLLFDINCSDHLMQKLSRFQQKLSHLKIALKLMKLLDLEVKVQILLNLSTQIDSLEVLLIPQGDEAYEKTLP